MSNINKDREDTNSNGCDLYYGYYSEKKIIHCMLFE